MEAYAELHQLPLSDVVARMWALYRDMSTMRETGKIRDTAIAAYQAAHPFVPDGDDTFVHCPSCQRMIAKAYLVTVEDVTRCIYCYSLH